MAIDIGSPAINRNSSAGYGSTRINQANPANASGIITSVEIWANANMTGCRVGTFYTINGNTLKCRDSAVIGNVTQGAKRTFNGLSIAVEAGDYIGWYATAGKIEADYNTGQYWYASGEHIDPGDEATYSVFTHGTMSLYGKGEEVAVGWTGKVSGVTNPAKVMEVDVANIAKVHGVA